MSEIKHGLSLTALDRVVHAVAADISTKACRESWHQSRRSRVLIVPGVVARMEQNVLINDTHPEFGRIACSLHQPIWWDQRVYHKRLN